MKKERKIDAQKSAIKEVVESGNQGIEKHVTKKRERGITLIALVVTIIIMLILAAVTLNMALGDNGLIQMAKFAANRYEQAAINESLAMQGLANDINNPGSGTQTPQTTPEEEKPDRTQLKIGDVVDYEPDGSETSYSLPDSLSGNGTGHATNPPVTINQDAYTWKIMNIGNDGTVDIMGVPTYDMKQVFFEGPTGYNNGVYLLNEICKTLYSNKTLGVEARSINMGDVDTHFSPEGKAARDNYTYTSDSVQSQYGNTHEPYTVSNAYYPNLAKYEDHVGVDTQVTSSDTISESDPGSSLGEEKITIPLEETDLATCNNSKKQATANLYVKQTYYNITPEANYFNDYDGSKSNFYDLIFNTETDYWLASRCTSCEDTFAFFGLRLIRSSKITLFTMFRSSDEVNSGAGRLAPVVSFGPNIQFIENGDNSWKLSKQ